jgi:microcystin-dependent protein
MEGYIGEIRGFAGNFAPRAWAFCEGQLLSIASNTALFSILGTTYGGDGRTTFALPDLRGRVPIQQGTGPGLPNYQLGQSGGSATHTMIVTEMPSHNHTGTIKCQTGAGNTSTPEDAYVARVGNAYSDSQNGSMAADALTINNTGGGQPFSIMQPYLAINFIICLQGIFPSRN